MNAKLHLWSLAASVLLLTGVACGQGQSKTLAVVNGESITEDQVQKEASTELERLEQKHQQFLKTFERDKKAAVEDALDKLVNDKVLGLEAKKRSITVDQLVQQEVENKTTVPSARELTCTTITLERLVSKRIAGARINALNEATSIPIV